jgi:hypothetical protein
MLLKAMGFKKTCFIFAAVSILLFVTLACPKTHAAGPIQLKMAMAYPTKIPLLGSLATRFAKEINQRSHGKIKVKLYEPNTVVYRSAILDAVAQGTVDAGWAIAGMWSDKNQAFHIFWGPQLRPETIMTGLSKEAAVLYMKNSMAVTMSSPYQLVCWDRRVEVGLDTRSMTPATCKV